MFPKRPDLLAQHAALTERVRKLEVMNVSRVLKPRQWEPTKDYPDAIVGHAALACGVHVPGGGQPYIPPAAHYLHRAALDDYHTGGFNPQVALEFYYFCQYLGIGPRIHLTKLVVRQEGWDENHDPRWVLPVTTGGEVDDEKRTWYMMGLPAPIMLFPDEWHPHAPGEAYPGLFYKDEHGDLALLPSSAEGILFAEFYPYTPGEALDHFHIAPSFHLGWRPEGDPLVERATFYHDGSQNQDCGEPPTPEPGMEGGYPYIYYRSDQGMPCQNSIFSNRTGGQLTYQTVFNPTTDVAAATHPQVEMERPVDVYHSSYPGWNKLLERAAIVRENNVTPELNAWWDKMIPQAAAIFNSAAHEGWHQMELLVNWWGVAEVMVTGAEVRFRGEVFNFANRPTNVRFAKMPNYIPFPPWNSIMGTTMRTFLQGPPEHDGKVVLVKGTGGGGPGAEHPDADNHAYLEMYRPQLGVAPPNGYTKTVVPGSPAEPWAIRLDGLKWSTSL